MEAVVEKGEELSEVRTMGDLASLAGVSLMTVHRAFHDHRDIRGETRRRILDLATAHGYRPNGAARMMRGGSFKTIGLVAGPADLTMAFLVGAHRRLVADDMNLSFVEVPYQEHLESLAAPRIFRENLVDGLLMHAGVLDHNPPPLWLVERPPTPVVWLESDGDDSIRPDGAAAMRDALRRLAANGCGGILYLGPIAAPHHHQSSPLYGVFTSLARKLDIPCAVVAADADIPKEDWRRELRARLSSTPGKIGIVTTDGDLARFACALCEQLGLADPARTQIISFGDSRLLHADLGKRISTYSYSSYKYGTAAAKALLRKIAENTEMAHIDVEYVFCPGDTTPQTMATSNHSEFSVNSTKKQGGYSERKNSPKGVRNRARGMEVHIN